MFNSKVNFAEILSKYVQIDLPKVYFQDMVKDKQKSRRLFEISRGGK